MAKDEIDKLLISEYDPLAERRRIEEDRARARARRKRIRRNRILAVSLAMALVFMGYLCLDISKVRNITVTGNSYLTQQYILGLAGLDYDSRIVFTVPSYIASRLRRNALIEDARVTVSFDRTVSIDLTLKKAVGYYWLNDQPYILLASGAAIPLGQDLYSTLTDLPLIKDDTAEADREALAKALRSVPDDVLSDIAEIWRYHTSYDDHMYRFVMADGNQVFMAYDSVPLMESYYGIAAQAGNSKICLMLNAATLSGYTRKCSELNAEEKAALAAAQAAEAQPPGSAGGQ